MPVPDVARKQQRYGAVAGIALLAFALAYRFFPSALHLAPPPAVAEQGSGPPAVRSAPTWSATRANEARVGTNAEHAAPVGTSLADALRMGPPAPTTRIVRALLDKAKAAEERGDVFTPPNGNAIALYREAFNAAPDNREAEDALARISGAVRDWTTAAIDRGDEAAAQRHLEVYAELPHVEAEYTRVKARVATLRELLPMLTRAASRMREGKLVEPADDSALSIYRAAVRLDPQSRLADEGLASIERVYLDRALVEAARDDFAAADRTLGEAASIRPGSSTLLETRARIEDLRRQRAGSVLAQALSALDSGDADLAEHLAKKAQSISPDLPGLGEFETRLRNARLYASLNPGEVVNDRYVDVAGQAPALVVVPTGAFVMGSPADEAERADSEGPTRTLRIGVGFALGQTEVTVAQFREFMRASRYVTDAERAGSSAIYEESSGRMVERRGVNWKNDYAGERARDDVPVVHVSWNDAAAYAAWLSARTGKHYRLPSEAEFEYALRAGGRSRYPWGEDDPVAVIGNFTGDGDRSPSRRSWSSAFRNYADGYWGPAPVRSFVPNRFGLYDLSGNVSEWTEDCWHDNYLRAPTDASAWINPGCERRVVRGGSWGSDPAQFRSAFRFAARGDTRSARIGFRVARDL